MKEEKKNTTVLRLASAIDSLEKALEKRSFCFVETSMTEEVS